MKNLIKINLLVIGAIIFCNTIHAQQRASDKPFSTVLNEIKQQQAKRNKMLQQMRQTTPVSGTSQSTAVQTSNYSAAVLTKQSATPAEGTSQQGPNDKPLVKPVMQAPKSGKQ